MVRRRAVIRLSGTRARTLRRASLLLASFLVLLPFLFPFAWMVMGSLKSQVAYTAYPPVWTFRPTLDNYEKVFTTGHFGLYALNSTIVAGAATIIALLLGIPAAYAVARYRLTWVGLLLLVARMAPLIAFVIPLFVLYAKLHLVDTYTGLVAAHLLITLPIVVWMMVGFIEALPREIEEAARLDGAGAVGLLWRIVVPLTAPGIAAASILSFIFSWNNFLVSVVLSGYHTKLLPVGIFNFLGYESINWGPLSAAASIVTIPVLALALVAQRYIVRGILSGGLLG
ncbi:MAG: carbohydrate ABC transporter permease [Rhodospirillales bacterium]|nr:carbohydrate ABC transporter permease [Rhodospirillales bacterium]